MKRMVSTLAVLALAAGTAWADVTKEDLKKLVRAGVGDDVVLAYVRASGPLVPLSAEDIVDLKQSGASEKLLQSLLSAKQEAKAEPPSFPQLPAYEERREPQVVEREVIVERPRTVYVPSMTYYYSYPSASLVYCGRHYAYDSCGGYAPSYYAYGYYPRSYYYRSYPSYGFSYYRHGRHGHSRSGWSVGWCW